MEWEPLDPEEGPSLWVRSDGNGLMLLAAGSDPENPTDRIMLNRREYQQAGEQTGFR